MKPYLLGLKAGLLVTALVAATATARADLVVSADVAGIRRYNDTTGAFLGVLAAGGGVGLTFGPNGDVYSTKENPNPDSPADRVVRYDWPTGKVVDVLSGGLDVPRLLKFGPDGDLYVTNLFAHTVVRFDGKTDRLIGTFADSGGDTDIFEGLAFGRQGDLFVSDAGNDRVLRFNGVTGKLVGTFASGGGLAGPSGLAFGPDGNLYVASFGSHSVIRYDGQTGAFLDAFASGGGLQTPYDLAFGPDGNLYVSDTVAGSILRFNGTTGAPIDTFIGNTIGVPFGLAFTPAAVPEPASVVWLSWGTLALIVYGYRRRSAGRRVR